MYVTPTVVGKLAYVASCSGVIYAFDKDDGSVAWSYDTTEEDGKMSTFHGDPLVTDELLVVPADSGRVYAFALESGEPRWKSEPGAEGRLSDLVLAASSVVGASRQGGLFALDPGTGAKRWAFQPPDVARGARTPSPVVAGDRLYYADAMGGVHCLDAVSGEVVWSRDLGTGLTTSLVLIDGQVIAGGSNRRLYRLEPEGGEITAELELPIAPVGTPVLAGGALVLTDSSSFLIAVEADLGGLRWSQAGRWSTERVLADGESVVAGRAEGELAALGLADGERLWSTSLEGHLRGLSKVGDTYYVGTVTGTVYAYRRSPEDPPWEPAAAVASAPVASEAGHPLGWMTGHWRGAQGEGVIEEVWTALEGGSMMGMFRLVSEGALAFSEFMSIEMEAGAPVLRIKHFSPALRGWEERDESVTFDLVSVEDGTAVWQERGGEARLTYRLTGGAGLEIVLDKPESRSVFELRRR